MTREQLEAIVVTSPSCGRGMQRRRLCGIEDYLFIGGPQQHSNAQAAARLGVSKRTVERWRALLREAS